MVTSHEGQAARLMTSIVSWQAAHPALNTSIFRLAGISLVPFILALPRPNGSRWQTLPLGGTFKVKRGVASLKRRLAYSPSLWGTMSVFDPPPVTAKFGETLTLCRRQHVSRE